MDAALACLAERGLGGTTVDDIARRAGCSRATLYRVLPGGKDAVLAAVVETEGARLMADLAVRMGGASSAAEVVVQGVLGTGRWLASNRALGRVLAFEPEAVAPHLAFDAESRLLQQAAAWTAPFLRRWLAPADALRIAEWGARLVTVYGVCGPGLSDLTDEAWVRRMVETFVEPGLDLLLDGATGRRSGGAPVAGGRADGGRGAVAATGRASRGAAGAKAGRGHRREGGAP